MQADFFHGAGAMRCPFCGAPAEVFEAEDAWWAEAGHEEGCPSEFLFSGPCVTRDEAATDYASEIANLKKWIAKATGT